jgi:MATE family multidrug resistance protein
MALTMEAAARLDRDRTRGGLREVIALAYPVIITNLSATLMTTIDSAMVGRLGAIELAAIGYAQIWYWTAVCFFVGAASGVQTFVSQAHGQRDARACGGWAWQGLYAVVPPAALWIAFFAASSGQLFHWLGPSAEIQSLANSYVVARAPGAAGLVGALVLISFFRGIGDTRTPLYAMIIAVAANVFFAYGMIFGRLGMPDLGLAGAAAATAIAEWVQFVVMLIAFRRRRIAAEYATAPVRPNPTVVWRFLRTSMPIGGQWVLEMSSFAVFANLVARMGDIEMAASQAMLVLQHMSFMQVMAVAIAATTLVGRYCGMGDMDAAERSHRNALCLGVGFALSVGVLFLTVPELMLRLFTQDAGVVSVGSRLLAIAALFQTCDAVGVVTSGSLRGAGDTRWPFAVQASLAWGLFLPTAYLFGRVWDGGVEGAWLAGALYLGILGIALVFRFRRGVWKEIRI